MAGRRLLAVRLDNLGDVLVTGPAVRAMATAGEVTMLCGPRGAAAARLLPGVDDVVGFDCPWITSPSPAYDAAAISQLINSLDGRQFDEAVVFTSWHQSPLPTALLLRQAGVGRIAAISDDYPGALLDVRHRVPDDIPEPERALSLADAAGFRLPTGDDGGLAVRKPLPPLPAELRAESTGYVVVHPSASVPARAASPRRNREFVAGLAAAGFRVAVTGGPGEREMCADVAGRDGVNLAGRLDFAELAAVIAAADAIVVGNTGPAHLAAAVGTPVVSLYAPVIPAVRWAPYRVPSVLLGDQQAPCRDSRATVCPVPGHPCLDGIAPAEVVAAAQALTRRSRWDDERLVAAGR